MFGTFSAWAICAGEPSLDFREWKRAVAIEEARRSADEVVRSMIDYVRGFEWDVWLEDLVMLE